MSTTLKYLMLCGCFLSLFSSCKKEFASETLALGMPDMNVLFMEYDRVDSLGNYREFADEVLAANEKLQSSELYVEAALLYKMADRDETVVNLLNKAIDRGMSNPKILAKFPELRVDPGDEELKKLNRRLDSIQKKLKEVSHFSLEISSLEMFWRYFDRALQDTTNAKAILRDYVLDGPRELRDYYVVRYSNLENMYGQMINAAPEYYTFLKDQLQADSLQNLSYLTIRWMKRFKSIYPQAVFPKVFIVPGILNSGGTSTEMGLFVGGDMYGRSDKAPVRELNDWQRGAIMKFSDLPGLTLHELMHFQQNYQDKVNTDNVLRGIIGEGVCDFLVELVSGIPLKNDNLTYLSEKENEKRILADLKHDLFQNDSSKWLYNGGDIEDRPHDLGYTMGYLITRSYYEQQSDKKKAIHELLNSTDLKRIVKQSDYAFLLQ